MKCFVRLSHLRSNLGEVYLCHKNDEVFVSHFNNRLDMNDIYGTQKMFQRNIKNILLNLQSQTSNYTSIK